MSPMPRVAPGDLVTAQQWNLVLDVLERLEARLAALEASDRRVQVLRLDPAIVSPGDVVTVTGRNFAVPARENIVRLGDTEITSFLAGASGEQLAFRVPQLPDLPRDVVLLVANGWGEAASRLAVQPDAVVPTGRVVVRLTSNSHLSGRTVSPGDVVEVVWKVWSDTSIPETYDFTLAFRPLGGAGADAWEQTASLEDATGNTVTSMRLLPSEPPRLIPGVRLPDEAIVSVLGAREPVGPDVSPLGGPSTTPTATTISRIRAFGGAQPDVATRPDIAALRPDIAAARPDVAAVRPDIAAVRPDLSRLRPDIGDIIGRLPPDVLRPTRPVGPLELHATFTVPPGAGRTYAVLRVSSRTAPNDPNLNVESEIDLPVQRTFRPPAIDVDFRPPLVVADEGVRPTDRVVVTPGEGGRVTFPSEFASGVYEIDVGIEPDPGDWTVGDVTRPTGERITGGSGLLTAAGGTETLDVNLTAPPAADDTERFLRITARRVDTGEVAETFRRVSIRAEGP